MSDLAASKSRAVHGSCQFSKYHVSLLRSAHPLKVARNSDFSEKQAEHRGFPSRNGSPPVNMQGGEGHGTRAGRWPAKGLEAAVFRVGRAGGFFGPVFKFGLL